MLGSQSARFPKSGQVLRCTIPMHPTEEICGIPVNIKRLDLARENIVLPVQVKDRFYIVSSMIMDIFPEREDFIASDSSREAVIKDPITKKVVGSRGFQIAHRG